METFITTICEETGNIITCNYGGVLPYFVLIILLVAFSSFFFWVTYKLIMKVI